MGGCNGKETAVIFCSRGNCTIQEIQEEGGGRTIFYMYFRGGEPFFTSISGGGEPFFTSISGGGEKIFNNNF